MAKKNIRKIPPNILSKIDSIDGDNIVAGCAVKFKATDLQAGKLTHLGITLTEEGLHVPTTALPLQTQGKYSNININGKEITRKDLPKETHYNVIETPNFGDPTLGYHTVHLPYYKYPRDLYPPRELQIVISCQDTRPNLATYIIAFKVEEVLNKRADDFRKKLLEDLNLLQENIYACGVEAADVSITEYARSLHLSWEILPPGTLDETIDRVFSGKTPTQQQRDVTTERYNFFQSLAPQSLVFGQSGFRRYFGALLEDDLVIFENVEYGNAVYILFSDWEELSRLSRIELMSGRYGDHFERVVHTEGWQEKVRKIVEDNRNN